MASRRSLRLRSMKSEIEAFQDKCFICQRDIDIGTIMSCRSKSCCRKFVHKSCLESSETHTLKCGPCRNHPFSGVDLGAHEDLPDSESSSDGDLIWRMPIEAPTVETARRAISTFRTSSRASCFTNREVVTGIDFPAASTP